METRSQQQELRNYCFKIAEYLNIRIADFINICSLAYVPQSNLVDSFSICENSVQLIYVEFKL